MRTGTLIESETALRTKECIGKLPASVPCKVTHTVRVEGNLSSAVTSCSSVQEHDKIAQSHDEQQIAASSTASLGGFFYAPAT